MAAPIPQDHADAARPRRGAQRRRSASAACSTRPCMTPRSTCRARSWCRRRRGCATSSPSKDARFLWNEAMIAFGAASNLTGLRSTDNITIDGAEQTMAAVPRGAAPGSGLPRRRAGDGERAARAPGGEQHARVSSSPAVSLRGTSSFSLQYAGKELAATFRSPWPSPSFNGNTLPMESTRDARRLRGELADHGVRLAAHRVLGRRRSIPRCGKARPSGSS